MVNDMRNYISFSYQSMRFALKFSAVFVIIMIIAGTVFVVYSDYQMTLENAERRLLGYSLTIKEQSLRTLRTADQILQQVRQFVEVNGGLQAMNERILYEYLSKISLNSADIGGVFVLDHFGRLEANSAVFSTPSLDVSSRDYFRYFEKNPDARHMYIGQLGEQMLLGGWRYFPAKALRREDGNFDGVVALTLDAEYFSRVYRTYNIGEDTRTSLCRTDGTVFATAPFNADVAKGVNLSRSVVFTEYLIAGQLSGAYRTAQSALDGTERVAAYQILPEYSTVILVTESVQLVLRPFYRRSGMLACGVGLMIIVLVILYHTLLHKLWEMEQIKNNLAASEEKYSKAFAASADVIGLIRLNDAHWIEISDAFFRIFGSRRDEMMVQTSEAIHLWVFPDRRREALETLRRGGTFYNRETLWRTKNGDIRFGLFSTEVIEFSGVAHGLFVWHDITERKKNEEALAESRERFATAFRRSADVLLLVNAADMRCMEMSDSFYDKFGYVRDEIIGKTSLDVGIWDDVQERGDYLEQLGRENQVRNLTTHWRMKTGQVRVGILSGDVLNIHGRSCLLLAWHDQTELKAAETALKEANEALERKVDLRTTELSAANEELIAANMELLELYQRLQDTQETLIRTEKMTALARLVSGVAHEVNTPVGICVTLASHTVKMTRELAGQLAASTLKKDALREYIDESIETADLLLKNAEQAAALVRNFKQVSADQASEVRRIFAVGEYIQEILLVLRTKLKNSGHIVRVNCDDSLEMDGYPGALGQILTNLLLNALFHAFEPGERGHIDVVVESNGQWMTLRFLDDGKGMDADVREKIFDPFFTTRRNQGGTGLGLSIVHTLVTELFKGTIECMSQPGKGAEFLIRLPIKA